MKNLKEIIKEVIDQSKQNMMVGDIPKLIQVLNNQKKNWNAEEGTGSPALEYKLELTKEFDTDDSKLKNIKLTIESEELIFVFNSKGILKYIVCYKD